MATATTTTLIRWTPQVVTGPIAAAHAAAVAEAERTASALAPGRIQVQAIPTDTNTAVLKASGPGAVQQEYGARPHMIGPRDQEEGVLAGPNFGPVGAAVKHPGNPALHYVRRGAETYPIAFTTVAKRLFP